MKHKCMKRHVSSSLDITCEAQPALHWKKTWKEHSVLKLTLEPSYSWWAGCTSVTVAARRALYSSASSPKANPGVASKTSSETSYCVSSPWIENLQFTKIMRTLIEIHMFTFLRRELPSQKEVVRHTTRCETAEALIGVFIPRVKV